MKLIIVLSGIITSMTLWGLPNGTVNTNTWRIELNQKVLLSSQRNKLGDSVILKRNELNTSDRLSVGRFFCGHNFDEEEQRLILKNKDNQVIKVYKRKDGGLTYFVVVPINQV